MNLSKAVATAEWKTERFCNKRVADAGNLRHLRGLLRGKPKALALTLPGPSWAWEEKCSAFVGSAMSFVGVEINPMTHVLSASVARELGMRYVLHPEPADVEQYIATCGYDYFDVVYLDFTGPLTTKVRDVIWRLLDSDKIPVGGVLMMTLLMRRQPTEVAAEATLMRSRPCKWDDPELTFISERDNTPRRCNLTYEYVDCICGDAARMGVQLQPVAVQLYSTPNIGPVARSTPMGQFLFTRIK